MKILVFPAPYVFAYLTAAETLWTLQSPSGPVIEYLVKGMGLALTVLLFYFAWQNERRSREREKSAFLEAWQKEKRQLIRVWKFERRRRDQEHRDNQEQNYKLHDSMQKLIEAEIGNRRLRHSHATTRMATEHRFKNVEQWIIRACERVKDLPPFDPLVESSHENPSS